MFSLGGFGHQFDKPRMHQHPGDGDSQRHISFEFHRRGGGHHQRQEEKCAVADKRQQGQRRRAFRQRAAHLEDHRQQLDHRSADNRRDQRRHGADQRVEDPGADAFQGQRRFALRLSRAQVAWQQIHHLAVGLGESVADDHLALVIAAHDAEHPGQAFQGRAIDLFVVFNHEAQTGHAVGNGGDVVDPADCRDYLLRQGCIIFRHRILSCLSIGY